MKNEDKKILVVDDTQFMVTVITNVLKSANFNVVTASSGEEALEMVRKEKPDLILLDVVMTGMSGFDVCRKLRDDQRYNLIPIIMLTGQTDDDDKLEGLELGADDYVVKPFGNRELLARVRNTLVRLERSRGVNPLTGLPGNNDIEAEIARRINENIPFAVLYLDLNSFKPYNDIYGFANGDIAIKMTADIMYESVEQCGSKEDFVGHIGGDDFVVIAAPETAIDTAKAIIERFDKEIVVLYNEDDLQRGYIVSKDRDGITREFGLIGISVAIVRSDKDQITSPMKLAEVAAVLKKKAKSYGGKSAYVVSED